MNATIQTQESHNPAIKAIHDLAALNKKIGGHWFDDKTLDFFNDTMSNFKMVQGFTSKGTPAFIVSRIRPVRIFDTGKTTYGNDTWFDNEGRVMFER